MLGTGIESLNKLEKEELSIGNEFLGSIIGIIVLLISPIIIGRIARKILGVDVKDVNYKEKIKPLIEQYSEQIAKAYENYTIFYKAVTPKLYDELMKTDSSILVKMSKMLDIKAFVSKTIEWIEYEFKERDRQKSKEAFKDNKFEIGFCTIDYSKTDFAKDDDAYDTWSDKVDAIIRKYDTSVIEIECYWNEYEKCRKHLDMWIPSGLTASDLAKLKSIASK